MEASAIITETCTRLQQSDTSLVSRPRSESLQLFSASRSTGTAGRRQLFAWTLLLLQLDMLEFLNELDEKCVT